MRLTKLLMAFAFFMTSVTFESQIITTKNGLDNNWTVSISTSNEAFAREMYAEMQAF